MREVLCCLAHTYLILELLLLLALHYSLLVALIDRFLRVDHRRLVLRLLRLLRLHVVLTPLNRGVFGANCCGFGDGADLSHLNY